MIVFSHFTLLILSVALLLLVAIIEVWRSTHRDKRRKWLLWHLVASLVFCLCSLADESIYTPSVRLSYYLEYPAILAAALLYGELCYAIAGRTGSRQLKTYRVVTGAVTLIWLAAFSYALYTNLDYTAPIYGQLLILPILLFCWPLVIFTRELKKNGVRFLSVETYTAAGPAISDANKAMLGFLITTFLRLLSCTVPVLGRIPGMPMEFVYGFFFTNNLLIVGGMVITFLAFIERRANLAARITGVLSVAILMVSVFVTLAFFSDEPPMRGQDIAMLRQGGIEIAPLGSGYRAVSTKAITQPTDLVRLTHEENTAANITLPFEFPFFGNSYTRLNIFADGQLAPTNSEEAGKVGLWEVFFCRNSEPVVAVFCLTGAELDIYVASTPDAQYIAWMSPTVETGKQASFTFGAELRPDGTILLGYDAFPIIASLRRANAIGVLDGTQWPPETLALADMPVASAGGSLWFDLTLGRRLATHDKLYPLAIMLIIIIALLLVFLRPYLSRVIVKPLDRIRAGVKQVDEGNLDHRLDVGMEDEVSDIAHGFNAMLQSLDRARQRADEQTELLEAEIQYRTIEAAKKIDPDILSKDQVFEQKLRQAIEENLGDFNFQVTELAEALAVSTRQLHRRVVNLTAQTPAALIRSLRLEYGHKLLIARAANVSEAAYKCGFRDVSYFTKLFTNRFGKSPSDILNGDQV
ncbi:helix-turn-helix transcriptional regulator [Kordiimonas aestuarii]|uniref:helix-turn-helix transcriptional regulator n=1 Tax=Kordiimonas aestuarii TaxID=1005925 RepID=UPI0021D25711|nr:helix-turn-helix domain-containing protein [Kordiimonas aestuarii]